MAGIRRYVRQARLILSNTAVLQDDLPTAEEWLEQVLDNDPQSTSAMNDLGYLWADQGKHLQRALRMIRKAVAAEPDNEAYLDSLGWALYRLGGYSEAVVHLERAVSLADSPDGVILGHLGDAYLKNKQPDRARDTWQRALKQLDKKDDADEIKATRAKLQRLSEK